MMEVRYVNSINQSISFFTDKIKISDGLIHKRQWTINDGQTQKDSISYNITLTLRGGVEERKKKLDELHDIFEIDLINNTTGKLYCGNYYIRCYMLKAETQPNSTLNCRTDNDLEVYCPKQSWIKENIFNFLPDDTAVFTDPENKTYPYRYDYKYGSSPGSSDIENDSLCASDFKLIIYGPVNNPSITIGDYLYNVNVELNTGEYLTVESLEREVFITDVSGNTTNVFDFRNKDNYLFQKIEPGLHNVEWSGGFGFDVILYDERSEPKWI